MSAPYSTASRYAARAWTDGAVKRQKARPDSAHQPHVLPARELVAVTAMEVRTPADLRAKTPPDPLSRATRTGASGHH